jgi:flagellar hook-associated protein 2
LTIESARARVDRETELEVLNGFQGVRRGVITMSDRSGASADIDLSGALTVGDVLDAINAEPRIRVRATVTGLNVSGGTGDRIVIEDETGLTQGRLTVVDRAGGFTASDLGVVGSIEGSRLDGSDLLRLSDQTPLSFLNDGNGVGRGTAGFSDDFLIRTAYGDIHVSLSDSLSGSTDLRTLNNGRGVRLGVIRVTDRAGRSAEIDLRSAVTVQDVVNAIEAGGVAINVSVIDSGLQIRDTSETTAAAARDLIIEDVSGFAAADLGIVGRASGNVLAGRSVYRVATVGDVIRAINFAPGNQAFVEAAVSPDGKGITLRALGFDNQVTVQAADDSTAARDLGIENATFDSNSPFVSRRLIGGLNSVLLQSLRGGAGVTQGTVRFTDRSGRTATIDFSAARTLQDVIDLINANGVTSLAASVNAAGNGIVIQDREAGTGGAMAIEDVTGTLAADLGIAVAPSDGTVAGVGRINGGNLQLQYVSGQTLLSDLTSSASNFAGDFRITDSAGGIRTVRLTASLRTVGEVIDEINRAPGGAVEARINDTGDGMIIMDRAGGSGTLTIQDLNGGRAAAELRLAGSASTGQTFIDGAFETRISVSAQDTLRDLAARINQSAAGVSAAVVRGGSTVQPFSLTLTSATSGRRGALAVDFSGTDFGFDTLVGAQDAVLAVGTGPSARIVTSSTNTFEDVIEGLTLDAHATSDAPVTVTVARDVDTVVESVRAFVDAYNAVQEAIDERTSFNSETLERGVLLGDSTVNVVRSRLHRLTFRSFGGGDGERARLFSVGIRLGADNRLTFDETKFRDAYAADPSAVETLFADAEAGFGKAVKDAVDELRGDFGGVISRRNEALADQQELINGRIEALNGLLAAKRRRLEAQFVALESALAGLQRQQNALSALIDRQFSG